MDFANSLQNELPPPTKFCPLQKFLRTLMNDTLNLVTLTKLPDCNVIVILFMDSYSASLEELVHIRGKEKAQVKRGSRLV